MSGLINPSGAPADVIRAVVRGTVVAVASRYLLDELAAVLARPRLRRWVNTEDAEAFLDALERAVVLLPDPDPTPPRVRDPSDDYLVALAEGAEALVVTGDDDLLSAELSPPALTPRGLLERLSRPPPTG